MQAPSARDLDTREYTLTKPQDLIDFLVDANVRLVRFEYLRMLARTKQLCPRRQEAELEEFQDDRGNVCTALATLEELKELKYYPCLETGDKSVRASFSLFLGNTAPKPVLIVSVSHCWESQQHADPWGFQLWCLAERMERRIAGLTALKTCQVWVFVDWICLPQYKRTHSEQQFFHHAMTSMHVLYAHADLAWVERLTDLTPDTCMQRAPSSVAIYCEASGALETRPSSELLRNSTQYCRRGWCVAETQWISTRAHITGVAPISPATFQDRVKRGEQDAADGLALQFTHRSDAAAVMRLQEKVFLQQASARTSLVADALPVQEVLDLAESVSYFKSLKQLSLADSQVGAEGATALAQGLQGKNLYTLILDYCEIGDLGAMALADLLPQCSLLMNVSLRGNNIGDAGAAELGPALRASDADDMLEVVDLSCNRLSDEGGWAFLQMLNSSDWQLFGVRQRAFHRSLSGSRDSCRFIKFGQHCSASSNSILELLSFWRHLSCCAERQCA